VIFANPQSDAAKKLSEIERGIVKARQQERELHIEHQRVLRDRRQIKEELTEAHARGKPTDKLDKKLAQLRNDLEDHWPSRVEGARRAQERAQFERDRFMSEHFEEIAGELIPHCTTAADDVQRAVDALLGALGRWQAEATRFEGVMRRVPGVRSLTVPVLPVHSLEQELGHIDGRVPIPVPPELLPDDEDEEDEDEAA
jgi:chromosome segregation ATPase